MGNRSSSPSSEEDGSSSGMFLTPELQGKSSRVVAHLKSKKMMMCFIILVLKLPSVFAHDYHHLSLNIPTTAMLRKNKL